MTDSRIVVITGAASGIGFATAELFRDLGDTVYGLDILPTVPDGVTYVEYHDATQQRTITLNTASFANGAHTLSIHGHGMAASGRQLAAEVKVPITISN